MRLKPRAWGLISLLLFGAAIGTWQYAQKYDAAHRPAKNRPSAALPPQHPPMGMTTAVPKAAAKPKSYRISNTGQTIAQLLRNSHALILRNAWIDTEVPVGLKIPPHLRARGAPGSYLVQADRPLDKDFYAELRKAGASYISYVPNNAVLVQATPTQATNLAAKADVIVVLPYEPYYKLDATLLPSAVEQLPQTNVLGVTTYPGQRDAALAALTQLGAKLIGEDSGPFGPTLVVSVPPRSLVAVAQLPLAQEIEAYSPRHLLNDLTRVRLGVATNTLLGTPNYLNLSGSNVIVNLSDTGVDGTHPDFSPTNNHLLADPFNPFTMTDLDGHGTHVAGIIMGNGAKSLSVTYPIPGSTNNADFRGKASNATLFVQDLNEPDIYLQTNAAANLGPTNLISNNSWGYNSEVYDMAAASYDAATRDALPNAPHGGQPLLFVFASGDGGTGSGSVNSPGTAKNVITVGAIDSLRNITNKVTYDGNLADGTPVFLDETDNSNLVWGFSGSGNVGIGVEGLYGRFKPDVVAPGVFTISCRSVSYVDPTNEPEITDYVFTNQTVAPGQTNSNYPIYLPDDTSQLVVVISTNGASPVPFPTNMLLLGDLNDPPTTLLSTNFSPGNPYIVTNFTPDQVLFLAVAPPTNQTATQAAAINYNLNIYLYETNDILTNYFFVVSNLNNPLRPWYMYQTGTSMAAGAVSGLLALMQEFLQSDMKLTNASPALYKAMLINGSRSLSLPGNPYDFNVNPLSTANEQGWGLPNISNCIPASLTNTTHPSMLLLDQSASNALATDQYQSYTVSCADTNASTNFPFRVTLVWTDPPGNPLAGVALVNDLQLTVADSTGTNVYVGNNFLSGDIYTELSTSNIPPGDLINNVQNVYINPTNHPIQFPLTVTVTGWQVNVNAVTTQTNDIMQDYALVISSDDPALTNGPMTIVTNLISVTNEPPSVAAISNATPLLHQRVGANEPNLYMSNNFVALTNGNSNQWRFYVFTNTQFTNGATATNVAIATFLPPNLSIPRGSGADIDLYVSVNGTDPTNNFPLFVQTAVKSVGRTGNESIIFSNSVANEVYYIGVKSEDQQGADFGLYAVAQQAPFSGPNGTGGIGATGTGMPVTIPDATSPQPALVFAFLVNPDPVNRLIRRVVVTNVIQYPSPDDLYGTLQFSGLYTILNAYGAILPDGINNVYDDLQEDPASGTVVTAAFANGTPDLTQYAGMDADGLWLLTEASRAIGQSGAVNNYGISVDLQQPQLGGFIISNLCAGQWYDDYIDVPNDATNLILTATFINASGGSIGIYLTNFDNITTSDYGSNNNAPNGTILSLSTNFPVPGWPGSPPLSGGRWFYGIYNSGSGCVTLGITNFIQESLTPNLVQSYTNNSVTPLTTDGHTQSLICLTNVAAGTQVVSLQIGVRIDDTNLDDLVLHLTSPQGTTVNLFEDRGGTNASALGLNLSTNLGVTNYVYTIFTEDTNLTTTPIKFAPPPFATNVFVPPFVLWSNSFETVPAGVYTNNTNLPVFLEGWLVTNNVIAILTSNGPALQTNNEVGIVTDTNVEQYVTTNPVITNLVTNSLGTNFLALTSGRILQTFGATNFPFTTSGFNITNGQPYQLVFYAKPLGITDWWPADNDTSDLIGTNNGAIPFSDVTFDVGEVGRAFTFSGISPANNYTGNEVDFGTNAGNFGTNDFTIEFWIKQPPYATSLYGVLEKRAICQATVSQWSIRDGPVNFDPASVAGQLDLEVSDGLAALDHFVGTNIINDGLFHHAAFTRCSNILSLYIDGKLDTSVTNPAIPIANLSNNAQMRAGQSVCVAPGVGGVDNDQPFEGDLDELDLFNRALSPAEIYAIYHAGSLGKYTTNSIPPNFQVTIDGVATNIIVLTNASGGWQLFTNSFTANSDQVTIEFSGNAMGVLLDGIQLIQEPATNYDNYYLPEEPLTPFVGQNPLGCWTLDVWDTRNDSVLPTNGTLLSWDMQVTTSSTNATLYVLTNDVPVTVSVTNNGMTYFAIDVPPYATFATNLLTAVSNGPLALFFDQTNLPTGGLPGDVGLTNGIIATNTSTNVLATLGAPPPLLPGQRYFLGVLNTGPATFTMEVDFNGMTNPITPLTNTVPVPTNVIGTNAPDYYSFVVPSDAVLVTFQIINSTNGEVDLYASDGLPLPGPLDFDYAGVNAGASDQFIVVTTNSVQVALPGVSSNDVVPVPPATWYLAAYNSATNSPTATNGYTIIATYVTNGQITIIPLTNGVAYTYSSAPPGYPTNLLYSYTETNNPAGIQFTVNNQSGVGNVELLAGLGVIPTPDDFYSGSFNPGTISQLIQIGTNGVGTNFTIVTNWYLVVPNPSASNVTYSIEATDLLTGPVTNAPLVRTASVSAATGKFTMSWAATPGQTYQVEISTNLLNWALVTNVIAPSNSASYTDPTPVLSQSLRFYRLKTP